MGRESASIPVVVFACFAVLTAFAAPKAPVSALKKWAVKRVPGSVGEDLRAVADCVTWDAVEFGESLSSPNCTFVNLRVQSKDDGEPLLRVGRLSVAFAMPSAWRPLPLVVSVSVDDVAVAYKAYDVQMKDSNWHRVRKRGFPPKFAMESSSNATTVLIRALDFRGDFAVAVEPCDALGGEELRAVVRVDWQSFLGGLSRKISAAAAPLEPEDLYNLLRDELTRVIRDTLLDRMLHTGEPGEPPGAFSLGGKGIADLQTTVRASLTKTLHRNARRFMGSLGLKEDHATAIESEVAGMFEKVGADYMARRAQAAARVGDSDESSVSPAPENGDCTTTDSDHAADDPPSAA
mmetsp:Transcript_15348/g.51660  ORF Transcript_15348/g.51660 Transcript_15348/m.51660 type:complete len:349 (+) Transcript_15348:70-1116(+)